MSINPVAKSALRSPYKTCGLNSIQVRTSFYNKYKHGPTRASNPKPDYIKWCKDFFGPEGKEWILKHAKRIVRKPIDNTHLVNQIEPGKIYKFEKFDSEDRIKLWKPVADSDSKNGFSISTFSRSPSGFGQFKGILDNRVPLDGLTQKSGFVAAIGPRKPAEKIYEPDPTWHWLDYNTVNIKFRGDGRKYHFFVNVGRYDNDLLGYDLYSYPLHTRGGPYWQTIQIPFNRLVFSSKMFIQNEQYRMPRYVKFVGFNLHDTYDGPFCLEIAYIGLSYEWTTLADVTAYETYSYPHLKYRQISPGCDPPDSE